MDKPTGRSELHQVFQQEAEEKTADIARICAELSSQTAPDKATGQLSELLRHLHNLKGAALSTGYVTISEICHTLEDTLRNVDAQNAPHALWACCEDGTTLIGLELQGTDTRAMLEALKQKMMRISSVYTENGANPPVADGDDSKPAPQQPVKRTSDVPLPTRPIKVPVTHLDELMGTVEELQITNSRFAHRNAIIANLISNLITAGAHDNRIKAHVQEMRVFLRQEKREVLEFANLCNQIEHTVRQIRMVPLSEEEPRWRSVVRESAFLLGKHVDVHCQVGEIKLDKNILDALGDVLLHILRNAVDHGIETPEDRNAAGKQETGTIRIVARPSGELVHIDISDDGKGPDWDRIRQRAVTQGLLPQDEKEIDKQHLLDLLFTHGFSTAEQVGQVSGRGVGLDVVRSRIEELGGQVTMEGEAGKGSQCHLALPSSVLSTNGLFVQCGPTKYGLPVDYVERTLRVRTDSVQPGAGHDSIIVDGEPVRLISLHAVLGREFNPGEFLTVLLLAKDDRKAGIIVDRSHAERAYISKKLPWNTGQVGAVSGAIVEGDGTLALALDVEQILSNVAGNKGGTSFAGSRKDEEWTETKVLVVDDSPSIRMLQKNLFDNAGYHVSTASDGEEAWALLQVENYDLLISDIEMPVLDGISLTRRVRQHSKLRTLPIILVTSRTDAQTREAGAQAGADEYVVKGKLDQEKLLKLVSSYV